MITRRLFSFGLLAAPAIIRTPGLLMPVRPLSPLRRERGGPSYLQWVAQEYSGASAIEFGEKEMKTYAKIARLDDIIGIPMEFTINGFKVVV